MIVYRGKDAFRPVGSIFTAVGLILLAVGGWLANRQYTIMHSWPSAEAAVTRSRVTHSRGRHGSTYQAEMEFRYTVDGKAFETPSGPGYSTSDYLAMKHMADAYAPGTRHIIRCNPSDPNDIRMNAGYNFGFFFVPVLLGGMGTFFAGLGIVFLKVSRSMRPLLCPSCGQMVEPGQRFCPNCATPLSTAEGSGTPPGKWAA